jgi:uncharacterized protein
LVSGLLKPGSNPSVILGRLSDTNFRAVVSGDMLNEYMDVLRRKEFVFAGQQQVENLLAYMGVLAFEPLNREQVFDGVPFDDAFFLIAAIEGGADYLITGNIRHFPQKKYGKCRVVTPAEFLIKSDKL